MVAGLNLSFCSNSLYSLAHRRYEGCWFLSDFVSRSIKIRHHNMVDHINQAIDVIIPVITGADGSDVENEGEKRIDISGYESNARPVYLIERKKDTELIRKHLFAKNRVLLRTFNTYAYYSCDIAEMQQKVLEHMSTTGAYSLIMELDNTNRHCIATYLTDMDARVACSLNQLLHDQSITVLQWQQMKVELRESRLDSLYFRPNTRRVRHMREPFLVNSFSFKIGKCSMAAIAKLSPRFNIPDFTFSHSSSSTHL